MNETLDFHQAVLEVRKTDDRYAPEAYAFLCEALHHTIKMLDREKEKDRHVKGQELLAGFRDLAVLEFGPMAWVVMQDWGIRQSEDVGNMVYNFINVRYFGKNDTDSINDFSDGVDLPEALTRPFRVARRN